MYNRGCMYMYLVEANIYYSFGRILISEDCFYHKYIHAFLSSRLCITCNTALINNVFAYVFKYSFNT